MKEIEPEVRGKYEFQCRKKTKNNFGIIELSEFKCVDQNYGVLFEFALIRVMFLAEPLMEEIKAVVFEKFEREKRIEQNSKHFNIFRSLRFLMQGIRPRSPQKRARVHVLGMRLRLMKELKFLIL